MAYFIKENNEVHRQYRKTVYSFGIFISVISFLICCLGVWLVYLKNIGKTEFTLFGQQIKTDSVGIGAIFIGAVVLIISLRKVFKSLDHGLKNQTKTNQDILNTDL